MAVKIKGYLTFRDVVGELVYPLEKGESQTLLNLIDWLSLLLGKEFTDLVIDPQTNELARHISILINGRHYNHLPDKLDTLLQDGDEVSIFPPLAGG